MSTWINAAIRTTLLVVLTGYIVFFMPAQIGGIVRSESEKTRSQVLALADMRLAALDQNTFGAIADTRRDVFNSIDMAMKRVDKAIALAGQTEADASIQVAGARADILTIAKTVDARLAAIQTDANSQLSSISLQLDGVISPAAKIMAQANEIAPYFLNCQEDEDGVGNKGCLPFRYYNLTSEMDQTLLAIARAAPDMANHADSISGSADHIAGDVSLYVHDLTKPQTKMAAIRTWLITIARITGAVI